MKPLIGITTYVEEASWGAWTTPAALVPLTYVRAVADAGGRPVLVPPVDDAVEETLDALDGIIFSGGADIDPHVYGATRESATVGIRPDRDRAETALMAAALERRIPVLAVCRGMQLLNVVRGGTLVQDLGEGSVDSHRQAIGIFARHDVSVEPGSRLCSILGDRSLVASHHHQAPARIGEGLRIAATAPDGTIEAVEDPGDALVIGVLWHPEEGEDRALFQAVVEQAEKYGADKR